MDTRYVTPHNCHPANSAAAIVYAPRVRFTPAPDQVTPDADATSTSTSTFGWIVSGVAAALAVSALGAAAWLAFDAMTVPPLTPTAAVVGASAPTAPSNDVVASAPTPVLHIPAANASPVYVGLPSRSQAVGTPGTAAVPGPGSVPGAPTEPIVTPPSPATLPAPTDGCLYSLVACDPIPPTTQPTSTTTKCDLVECVDGQPAPPPVTTARCDLVPCINGTPTVPKQK